jgi:WD40 repeat protein
MATFGTVTTTQQHNPNKSFEVVSPPTDGISSLSFSSKANYLVASSWDNQVRCWEIQSNGGSVPKAAISHDHPVRLKKILHDYLNSFQAKTVSNSNVKRGHCVWVMDAKAIFGRN